MSFTIEGKEESVDYIESHAAEDPVALEAEEKALLRKIDLYLLPTIWLMYLLSYLDRTNIGNAKIAGLQKDLALTSNEYSISLIVFFVTYVVFEIPSNLILSKTRPSLYLPIIMTLWGIVTCCMAAVNTYNQLVGLRIVVGILESGFAPGVLLIFSSWYKREEQSKRFAVYISAAVLSGAFGGLLAGAIINGLEGVHGIRGWRWLFIVEGAASCGWAIISSFILLDFPANTKKFSERERALAVSRLQVDAVNAKAATASKLSAWQAIRQALTNWRTWILVGGYMVIVGSSTLTYFYPTLVAGLGFKANIANYMVVPIYAVSFVCVAFTGYFADKFSAWRGAIIVAWLCLCLLCSIIVCAVYNYTARYVLLVFLAAGLWSTNALSLSYASSTFGAMPQETRSVALAFVNAMGNLAQIYGAYLFPDNEAPKYIMGFSVISAMCAFGIVCYAAAQVLFRKYPMKVLN